MSNIYLTCESKLLERPPVLRVTAFDTLFIFFRWLLHRVWSYLYITDVSSSCDSSPCLNSATCTTAEHPLLSLGIDIYCICTSGFGGYFCEIGQLSNLKSKSNMVRVFYESISKNVKVGDVRFSLLWILYRYHFCGNNLQTCAIYHSKHLHNIWYISLSWCKMWFKRGKLPACLAEKADLCVPGLVLELAWWNCHVVINLGLTSDLGPFH